MLLDRPMVAISAPPLLPSSFPARPGLQPDPPRRINRDRGSIMLLGAASKTCQAMHPAGTTHSCPTSSSVVLPRPEQVGETLKTCARLRRLARPHTASTGRERCQQPPLHRLSFESAARMMHAGAVGVCPRVFVCKHPSHERPTHASRTKAAAARSLDDWRHALTIHRYKFPPLLSIPRNSSRTVEPSSAKYVPRAAEEKHKR